MTRITVPQPTRTLLSAMRMRAHLPTDIKVRLIRRLLRREASWTAVSTTASSDAEGQHQSSFPGSGSV
jgi:hypothetical protein